MEYIDTYLSSDLSVDELADVACLSPYHFGKMFKRSMGQSVHTFVTRRRIERSKFLLKSSALSLGEVGAIVGFPEQSHFTTVFKRWVGITPKGYRRDMMPRAA
jgi:AraC family transcriptional regulator